MENEELLMDEQVPTLTLTDEDGVETVFEYLDCMEYNGTEYLILLPMEDPEGGVVILEVEPVDEETENYVSVQDEAVAEAVFAMFMERYQDSEDAE